ncbi:MAG TPA: hypothetical protein VHP33_07670 [Polyangiaceae bacterium]|nr:hypothetical protein [Polyangiaceae bacterium]
MPWDRLGWCAVVLSCVACGESSGNKPSAATGGANSGSAGNGHAAGSMSSGAGTAGDATGTGGSAGSGAGVGLCSGSTNQTPGTRIKAKFWVTSEGDRAWETYWDTQLNAACTFNPTSDGVYRCIPDNWDTSRTYFTDDQCTQALYTRMSPAPCEPADYIMQFVVGTCEAPGGYGLNELGAQVTPTTVYQKFGEGCQVAAPPVDPLFTKGAEVPPSMFAEATAAEYGAPARLKQYGYSTSDGTKQVSGWRDTQLGVNCYFQETGEGKLRCLPQGGATISGYTDATCSTPLMDAVPRCDKTLPKYALRLPGYECGDETYGVLERGEAFVGIPYLGTPESCMAGVLAGGATLYQTTPTPLESFQEVTHTIDESDPGRLKPRYYDAGSTGCWFHNFWDSELKQVCNFSTASDSKERCLPSSGLAVLRTFTDAACTVPAPLSERSECTPATLPEYSTNEMLGECGRRKYDVHRVGEEVLGSSLPPLWRDYGANAGGCVAFQPTAEKYLKLTLVDPSTFMAGEPTIQ